MKLRSLKYLNIWDKFVIIFYKIQDIKVLFFLLNIMIYILYKSPCIYPRVEQTIESNIKQYNVNINKKE